MATKFLDFGAHFGSILAQFWLQKLFVFESKIGLMFSITFQAMLAPFWEPLFISFASKIVPESEKAIL